MKSYYIKYHPSVSNSLHLLEVMSLSLMDENCWIKRIIIDELELIVFSYGRLRNFVQISWCWSLGSKILLLIAWNLSLN